MIRATQHVPGFVDGCTPKFAEAETIDELLKVDWIASYGRDEPWARRVENEHEAKLLGLVPEWDVYRQSGKEHRRLKYVERGVYKFYRFSLSDQNLMVEHDEGRRWWVVARLSGPSVEINLPKWEMHPDGRKRLDDWNKGIVN